jgi:KipI family sensor histidine kinase inhibitor
VTNATVLPYGPNAALIECSPGMAVRLGQALMHTARFTEVVPAERSVLVIMPRGMVVEDVRSIIHALPADLPEAEGRDIEVPVQYDGPDLDLVAEATGLTSAEVITIHSQTTYAAAFSGFAPGYVYCTGLDRRLWLPRRPSPRTSVPAGSVAIADAYTAVYPQASPGGWHLIGRTDLTLFDLTRAEPALIRPGDRVRFTVRTP